jgi:hypothetical protein
MNDIHETTCASASMSLTGSKAASGNDLARKNRMAATSVSGRPSTSRAGTLPSGLIAR